MTLIEPNDAQKAERDRFTHAEWGKGLSVDEYAEREQRLRAHTFSRRAMQTWFWVDGPKILSSCETFRMMSLSDGTQRGSSYGIASVFTEPALRGKGHATAMMRALNETLRTQDQQAHAAVLFSDVGAKIYQRADYEALPALDRVLPPMSGAASPQAIGITEEMIPNELAHTPAPMQRFLIWPTPDQLDWHLERERIYSEKLRRRRPDWAGARVGHSTIFWCVYFASDLLSVLLMNVYSVDDAVVLLREAQRAAAQAGVSKVQLWESAAIGPWQNAIPGIAQVERTGSLPMIHPFSEFVTAPDWTVIPRALWV